MITLPLDDGTGAVSSMDDYLYMNEVDTLPLDDGTGAVSSMNDMTTGTTANEERINPGHRGIEACGIYTAPYALEAKPSKLSPLSAKYPLVKDAHDVAGMLYHIFYELDARRNTQYNMNIVGCEYENVDVDGVLWCFRALSSSSMFHIVWMALPVGNDMNGESDGLISLLPVCIPIPNHNHNDSYAAINSDADRSTVNTAECTSRSEELLSIIVQVPSSATQVSTTGLTSASAVGEYTGSNKNHIEEAVDVENDLTLCQMCM